METRHVATVRSGYYTHTVELITWKQLAHETRQRTFNAVRGCLPRIELRHAAVARAL